MNACARLLFVLLAISSMQSCGGGDSAAEGSSRRRIAVIPKGTTHEFWKSIHAGAVKAGQELDVEIVWRGPQAENDRADQIEVVENQVAARVDGIVLAPLDKQALVGACRDAVDAGIPVVIADSGLDWDGTVSFVATDNVEGGRIAARRLGELLGGEGTAIMLRYQENSASTMNRESGFLEVMAAEFPNVEIVSSNQYAGPTIETAFRKAENLVQSHPDVDGIFCPNESAVVGMLRALQEAGRAGEVKFVGFDATDKLVEALRAGEVHGLVIQDPFAMGELGVRAVVDHLDGKSVAKRIDTGVHLATPENMDDAKIHGLLSPDLAQWLGE